MMINWSSIQNLLVNKKLSQIIGSWFGVDIFYADEHGSLHHEILNKSYEFNSHLLKLQIHLPHGFDYLSSDVEKTMEYFRSNNEKLYKFETFFNPLKGIAARVEVDGEFLGAVFAFPFIKEDIEQIEEEGIINKFKECGGNVEEVKTAIGHSKKLWPREIEYLKELIGLVAEEVSTYHEEITKREQRILDLNSEVTSKYRFHNMIGKSKKMQQIYNLLSKVSNSEATILIQGENGTGKELVAKAIHYNSPRKNAIFLTLNCSAFNDNLLDSELFGHVKGAFTGAIKDKKGLFEAANGGTLFLDEVGDTSLTMQVKLLRVLQEGTFLPVGATVPKKVNVRIIAATNRPLKEMIAKGEFREDLYYRINVINVNLPPLRERQEDINLLSDYFLNKRCAEAGQSLKQLSKKCLEKMLDYQWPGNVRELENEIERLVVLSGDDKIINHEHMSQRIFDYNMTSNTGAKGIGLLNANGNLKDAMEQLELNMIREGLKRCDYNKSKLAKELGISRANLIMKVERYHLDERKKASGE